MRLLNSSKNWRKVAALACGMALSIGAWPQGNAALAGVVTGVIDGDTIKVQLSSGPITVRLANIDAPELGQAGGGAATRALDSRVLGQEVSLDVVTKDQHESVVAVVYVGEENVNAWLVKQGHAWAYRPYTTDPNYCVWENGARSLRRGLWADKNWIAPWELRKSKHEAMFFFSDYSTVSTASCIRELGKTEIPDE
jgi:micrococcal nuclease